MPSSSNPQGGRKRPADELREMGVQLWTPVKHDRKPVAMKQVYDGSYVHVSDLGLIRRAIEGDSAERLKEVERQREEAQASKKALWDQQEDRIREYAEANTSQKHRIRELEAAWLSDQAVAAFYSYAPNIDSDNDAGPDDEEEAAIREALTAIRDAALTQPSSNPPQQDREDGEQLRKRMLSDEFVGEARRRFGHPSDPHYAERFRVFIDAAFDTLAALGTQPEADPEVPRCGGGGIIYPEPDQPMANKDCPGCTDCQPTPELLGEEGGFEHCKRCGRGNTLWFAPSPLWNAVMRGGSINGTPIYDDLVCATCFMTLAEERGIADGFKVYAKRVHVELETVTPSGRVWDEERGLWTDPASTQPVSESPGDSGEVEDGR